MMNNRVQVTWSSHNFRMLEPRALWRAAASDFEIVVAEDCFVPVS
jgi:hypothetical protein